MNKKSRDLFWYKTHSWLGLKLSLFLTFILITGTIAVFSLEIDWLLTPEMRSKEYVSPEQVAWGAAFDSVTEEYSGYELVGIFRLHDSWFSLQGIAITPWQESVRLWLDPLDGEFLGATSWYNVQRFFRSMHRNLMMPERTGTPIVSFMAIPLTISLIAGFIIYKKFWTGFFKRPRFDRKLRVWVGDFHRLAGLWISWFIALIAITSLWYFVEELGGNSPPFPPPAVRVEERQYSLPENFTGADLDAAVGIAIEELPGLQVRRILFPSFSEDPLIIQGDLTATLVRPRANGVYIDPLNLETLGSYRGEDLNYHTRISEAADPLHFGNFGGITSKIIWFIFGLFMTSMALTGAVIYTKRLGDKIKPTEELPTRSRVATAEEIQLL